VNERAELSAEQLLQQLGITRPPVDVQHIIETHLQDHLTLRFDRLETETAGLIVSQNDQAAISINANHSTGRQRFTMAHQLGHFILHLGGTHQKRPGHFIDYLATRFESRIRLRAPNASTQIDPAEMEANAFAAALLMPRKWVRAEFSPHTLRSQLLCDDFDERETQKLARRYRVSPLAMVFRLLDLAILR